ncbi:hypothetical protein [Allomuricauda sp. M10]|uniref:hypothetical protein n=1 Tax=Allomuricauda sp. M10 TaxID=2683292 RepID=UPI001D18528D|nr:hypothetical protein [Muricauda sp. M10]
MTQEIKKPFQKPSDKSNGEWRWIIGFRALGALMFIIAVYLPAKSLLVESMETIKIESTRAWFLGIGFFLVWGGGIFGLVANNLGKLFNSYIEKFTK